MLEEDLLREINKSDENPNEIIEIDDDETNNTIYDMEKVDDGKKPKKNKEKKPNPIKEMWNSLDKKKKILIIVGITLLILIVIGIILYFFVFKKDDKPKETNKPIVLVENDNYKYQDGKLVFIDDSKNELGTYECKNKDEDLCYVAYYSNEDMFDGIKYVYENGLPVETRSDILQDNFVLVYDNKNKENGTIILYDIKENDELGTYKLVKKVNEESVILQDENDKYGLVKFSGSDSENVIDFKYDFLGYVADNEKLVVEENLTYYILNLDGNKDSKKIPGQIKSFDDKYISVVVDNDYFIYDYDGKQVDDKDYDYITFKDGYIITGSGKKLFLFDSDMNALNAEGIKISSNSYNTKIIFDEDKKQIDKEEAFSITVNKDNIWIEYDEESKVINIYEGKLNSKQEYISYYDGILYIYSDAEKSSLIGTYACENKNIVDESSTNFENCNIAKEKILLNRENKGTKVGYLPIFNKRYIFIQDNPSVKDEDTIVLWDLKDKEKKATYAEVDAGYYTENSIGFLTTSNTLVMAKNTSGSYGIIRVENNRLSGIIPFKDGNDSIKYLKNNLLVKRNDGTYHLYDVKGTEITSKVTTSYEIIDYVNNKYILSQKGSSYNAYNIDGTILATDALKVEFYDKFYVAIDKSYKLAIYDYSNQKPYQTDEETEITVASLNDYKIEVSGNTVIISVKSKNNDQFDRYTVTI